MAEGPTWFSCQRKLWNDIEPSSFPASNRLTGHFRPVYGEAEAGVAFETRLRSLFVNPSLIISTELENKSPGNDAEPEIMSGF